MCVCASCVCVCLCIGVRVYVHLVYVCACVCWCTCVCASCGCVHVCVGIRVYVHLVYVCMCVFGGYVVVVYVVVVVCVSASVLGIYYTFITHVYITLLCMSCCLQQHVYVLFIKVDFRKSHLLTKSVFLYVCNSIFETTLITPYWITCP